MNGNDSIIRNVLITASLVCICILGLNAIQQSYVKADKKQAASADVEGYNTVEINGETFYEKDEDSNFAIDGVAIKNKNFIENPKPKAVLILKNDSGNVDKLDLWDTGAYEQIQDVSVEKSYVRKVTSNPNWKLSTKYFLYLTSEDAEKLTRIIEEQGLGAAGFDIVDLDEE